MIDNAQIKAAWIAKLKATSAVTARVLAAEIREENWKGERFVYPNIRVRLGALTPTQPNNNCLVFHSDATILVFGEQKSSKTEDEIAGIIATTFWQHPFTSGAVKFVSINLISVLPAEVPEWDELAWVAQVNFSCTVQSA